MPRTHRVKPPTEERALVVKAVSRRDRKLFADPFAEVSALANTAGVEVVRAIPQNMEKPNPATYLGSGKVKEAARDAQELDVDAVIADNDLSPAQERNLEKISRRKVVDRSQLILDIFARRARTKQAKLQVELAQLRYSLPRLKRMWAHLSRFEGGIGMRGPGETQLETDKRIIRRRIERLERQLATIHRRNEAILRNRWNGFVIAIVGYTNAGKSTLLNRLTGSNVLVENKLFATLEGRTRRWTIAPHRTVLLSDTVGFIHNLPHDLVASFRATLEEIRYANLLLHVVDATSLNAQQQIETVEQVLDDLNCGEKPTWILLNKWDSLTPNQRIEARHLQLNFPSTIPVFEISAASGYGLEQIARAVNQNLDQANVHLLLLIPHHRGDLIAYLRENGKVKHQEYLDTGVRIAVDLSPVRAAKYRNLCPESILEDSEGLIADPEEGEFE